MEKQEPNEEDKPIKLTPPEPSFGKKLWHALTCWRPLTKYEGGKYALMILKLSEAILNLERIQKKLVKNNNIVLQQLQAYKLTAVMKEEEEKKRIKDDKAFQ